MFLKCERRSKIELDSKIVEKRADEVESQILSLIGRLCQMAVI